MFNNKNSKKENLGSSIVEYGIIVALVIAVIIPIFMNLGNTIKKVYNDYSNDLDTGIKVQTPKRLNPEVSYDIPDDINETSATLENPIVDCKENQCSIDFGEFNLSGVPENFTDIIETSGSPGIIDTFSDLLNQIADKMEEQGHPSSQKVRNLANKGHNISLLQDTLLSGIDSCNGDTWCVYIYTRSGIEKPAGYIEDISNNIIFKDAYSEVNGVNIIAGELFTLASQTTNDSFYFELQSVLNDSIVTDTQRDVIEKLANDIMEISSSIDIAFLGRASGYYKHIPMGMSILEADLIELPDSPVLINYKSALICSVGTYKDINNVCQ